MTGRAKLESQSASDGRFDTRTGIESVRGAEYPSRKIYAADGGWAILLKMGDYGAHLFKKELGVLPSESAQDPRANHLVDPLLCPGFRPLRDDRSGCDPRLFRYGPLRPSLRRFLGNVVAKRGERTGEIFADAKADEASLERREIQRPSNPLAEQRFQSEFG
jgi:hypothetical protein